MKGIRIDKLNVYMKYINLNKEALIWSKSGNQGNIWMNGKINIISNETYKIIFEATRGPIYNVNKSLNLSKSDSKNKYLIK